MHRFDHYGVSLKALDGLVGHPHLTDIVGNRCCQQLPDILYATLYTQTYIEVTSLAQFFWLLQATVNTQTTPFVRGIHKILMSA